MPNIEKSTKFEYDIVLEPPAQPEYIVLNIKLPHYQSTRQFYVELSNEKFYLVDAKTKKDLFQLPLQYPIDVQEAAGQFHVANKELTVTLSIQK